MSRLRTPWTLGAAFMLGLASWTGIAAEASAQTCTDAPGASDHPSLPRYEGSCLIGYETKEFTRFAVPTGPAVRKDGVAGGETSEALEGRTIRLLYGSPADRSTLEVFRNYRNALSERGFEIVFECSGADCGARQAMGRLVIYPNERRLETSGDLSRYAFTGLSDDHYLAARSEDGRTWFALYVARNNFSRTQELFERAVVHADIVELGDMEERMIDAAAMRKSIGETGRVAINNVYFDFAKATLKPESATAIAEMAKLLRDYPEINVYIVGHTDNVGSLETNLSLSRARAEAVVAVLVNDHGIAKDRIVPAGVASLAPVASNNSESGRAENRRVELVER